MGKTIEVNLTLSNLENSDFRLADEKTIQSISTATADLSASFTKKSLMALINIPDCNAIRIYPAIYNNELIMTAWGIDRNNDLAEAKHFCIANVPVDGSKQRNGVDEIPVEIGKRLISGDGAKSDIIDKLNDLRQVEGYKKKLKVRFDDSFFNDKSSDFDTILFEVVDLKLQDDDTKKTIIAQKKLGDTTVSTDTSLLPCPPNCGCLYVVGIFVS